MSRVSQIWTARYFKGQWTARKHAGFGTGYSDGDPFVSYDGRRLYFVSVRPVGSPRKDFEIFVVDRTATGFGNPKSVGGGVSSKEDELFPSVDGDGTIYFASERSGHWGIYRARKGENGKYGEPEWLPSPVNLEGVWNFNPYISRDGRSLLFTSLNRPGGLGLGDIYEAKMGAKGEVLSVRNLGPLVNSAKDEYHATLSPNGRALFFMRRDHGAKRPNSEAMWIRTSDLGL